MPELPEVETMVRGVRPQVVGRKIRRMHALPCSCKPVTLRPVLKSFATQVQGATVTAVFRRAKRCVLQLSTGAGIVIEPRMTGLLLLTDPPDQTHLRLEWELASGGKSNSLWFWDRRGLGTVSLLQPPELQQLCDVGKLGPDALAMTFSEWKRVCAGTSRPIKILLLDQSAVAGIGNLYASEILFMARISPLASAKTLGRGALQRLAAATQEILETAIRYEGSTLSDGTYRNALNQAGRYQNAHQVYQRAGETCPRCQHAAIERLVQAQRSTFFCPKCQRD